MNDTDAFTDGRPTKEDIKGGYGRSESKETQHCSTALSLHFRGVHYCCSDCGENVDGEIFAKAIEAARAGEYWKKSAVQCAATETLLCHACIFTTLGSIMGYGKGGCINDHCTNKLGLHNYNNLFVRKCLYASIGAFISERRGKLA